MDVMDPSRAEMIFQSTQPNSLRNAAQRHSKDASPDCLSPAVSTYFGMTNRAEIGFPATVTEIVADTFPDGAVGSVPSSSPSAARVRSTL